MSVVRDHVVFDGESELQRQSHHKTRPRSPERPALGMRKENDAECVFAGLQADGREIANLRVLEYLLKLGECAG